MEQEIWKINEETFISIKKNSNLKLSLKVVMNMRKEASELCNNVDTKLEAETHIAVDNVY